MNGNTRSWSICGRRNQLLRTVFAVLLGACALGQTGCRAEQPWPLWQNYKARFLDSSGRIVDHTAGDRTTSEGQSYGMFFALVANDRPSFDRMLQWTQDNLAGGDLAARLPAWNWGRSISGEWKTLDTNSASDADLWLAYDCLEAGRLWQDPRLEKLGMALAKHVAETEVVVTGGSLTILLPGAKGFHPDPSTYIWNPSYEPPQLIARFEKQCPDGPWAGLQKDLPKLLAQSSPGGYAMDWLRAEAALTPVTSPQSPSSGEHQPPPVGSYESIRVYLWLGMAHKATPGVRESLSAVGTMRTYLRTHPLPPLDVDASGKVLQPEGTLAFSAAVLPYLEAWGDRQSQKNQMDRLAANVDAVTGLYGRPPAYYDQNLSLFGIGWMERRFRFEQDGRLKTQWK